MQEVQLYYRMYRRCSCTTGGAGCTAVPGCGTRKAVFKCTSPIDISYRNGSRCRRYSCTTAATAVLQEIQEMQLYYRRCRRYSCTWIWYRKCGIQVYKPDRRILQEWHQMHEVQLYYMRYRRYSCTTGGAGGTAVLQEVQEVQLYLDFVQERRYSSV